MNTLLSLLFVTSLCWTLASCKVMNIHIDGQTKVCGSTQTIMKESQATIVAMGNIPGASCSLKFTTADSKGMCHVCFAFEKYAFFNSTFASLSITSGPLSQLIDSTEEFMTTPVCTQGESMNMTLKHEVDYVYDPKEPGYKFVLDVYNECGYRGQAKSLSFEDVVNHAKGYHHGEEKTNRETQTVVTGVVVGICLACVFLIILLVAYCYVKNSPNRGTSKSAGMPRVGAKKSMEVRAEQGTNKPDVEMVSYKSKEAGQPEGKPLLTAGAAVVISQAKDKKTKKGDRKDSGSSASSDSSHDHADQPEEKKVLLEETPAPPEPSSDTHTTSAGESGYGGGSSDYTSSGAGGGSSGVGSSDYSSGGGHSGVGISDYSSGGGYSGGGFSGGSDYSSGGGGGGGGGGGDYSSGGGGGSDD